MGSRHRGRAALGSSPSPLPLASHAKALPLDTSIITSLPNFRPQTLPCKVSFTKPFPNMTGTSFSSRYTDASAPWASFEAASSRDHAGRTHVSEHAQEVSHSRVPVLAGRLGGLARTQSFFSGLDTFNTMTSSDINSSGAIQSSVSSVSLHATNVYPNNEYVEVAVAVDRRPRLPHSNKSFNDYLDKKQVVNLNRTKPITTTKQGVTPQRQLMQPIHPPLPRSQTLGNLLVCGKGSNGRASSELDLRPNRKSKASLTSVAESLSLIDLPKSTTSFASMAAPNETNEQSKGKDRSDGESGDSWNMTMAPMKSYDNPRQVRTPLNILLSLSLPSGSVLRSFGASLYMVVVSPSSALQTCITAKVGNDGHHY